MSRSSMNQPRPPAPEPLPVAVPDNHTHLDMVAGWDPQDGWRGIASDDAAVREELDIAAAVGIDRVVQVGTDVASSRWAADLAGADSRVLAAVALHPNDAPHHTDLDGELAELAKFAALPRVAAIGETGMDFFRTDESGRRAQRESFAAHIALAKEHRKPLMIHDRDAHEAVLDMLDAEGAPDVVVMHCFSGDAAFAAACAKRGYYMSFAGNVTFKNAPELRAAARTCPDDLLLVETDAPFMTPMPYRGRRNGPYLIPVTVRAIAETTQRDLETLCGALADNTTRVYGSW